MRVEVLMEFADKNDIKVIHKVGEVIEIDDNRAENCIARGLVKVIDEVVESKAPSKRKKTI